MGKTRKDEQMANGKPRTCSTLKIGRQIKPGGAELLKRVSNFKLLILTSLLVLTVGCADELSKSNRDAQSEENLEFMLDKLRESKLPSIPEDVDIQCPEVFIVSPDWRPNKIDGWSHLKPQPEKYFEVTTELFEFGGEVVLACDYLPHRVPWGTYIRLAPTGTICTVDGDTFNCRIPGFTE